MPLFKDKTDYIPDPNLISKWMGWQGRIPGSMDDQAGGGKQTERYCDNTPIEPQGFNFPRLRIWKSILFLLFISYIMLSYFRVPILTSIGNYLIIDKPVKKADLIVCLMGKPVERGLAAARLYKSGCARNIFFARVEFPNGYEDLRAKGVNYPESRDLLDRMLQGLGVPKSACITSDIFVCSTYEEAQVVRDISLKREVTSLIIITSPTHTRRAWLTFNKVFGKDNVRISVVPTLYSDFRPDNWWKTDKYLQDVILEYQKLFYYYIKYL